MPNMLETWPSAICNIYSRRKHGEEVSGYEIWREERKEGLYCTACSFPTKDFAMALTHQEPILYRLEHLDNMLRQLEEIRGCSRSPKRSCASTPTSGTLTSEGQVSSADFSPKSLEKHCRPIAHILMVTELKGTLIERLDRVEERVLKLGLQLEGELEAERKMQEEEGTEKGEHRKGLKGLVKKMVKGNTNKKHKTRN